MPKLDVRPIHEIYKDTKLESLFLLGMYSTGENGAASIIHKAIWKTTAEWQECTK